MKVLIRFSGDNDFTQVIMAFAKIIAPTTQQLAYPAPNDNWHQDRLTKQNIIKWFNTMAPALYEMVQARSRDPKTDQINIAGYLKINEDDVFFGDQEVAAKMETYQSWGNGDGVLIDFGSKNPWAAGISIV